MSRVKSESLDKLWAGTADKIDQNWAAGEIRNLRKALQFYADHTNYIIGEYDPVPVSEDKGRIARVALDELLPSDFNPAKKDWSYF